MAKKKPAAEIGGIIKKIESKLALLEEHAAWTIHADSRFKVGQCVEFSRKANECGLSKGRKGGANGGKITAIKSAFIIEVLLDGYKRTSGFHHSFFNPVRGPKLF